MSDHPDYFDADLPSKTQRKKDAHAQQELGAQLTQLADARLDELPLTNSLRAAIDEFKRLPNKRGAVKRQLQYIGRLIRDCDTDAIAAALADQPQTSKTSTPEAKQLMAEAERWRDIIVQQGDDGIQQAVATCPAINRQELRQLYRNYSRATDAQKAAAKQRIHEYLLASLGAP